MLVSDVFQSLAVGELSTLGVSDGELETIKFSQHPRFIRYLNDTLTLIYSKFAHKIDYVNFQLVEGQSTYVLQPEYVTDLLKINSVQNLDYEFEEDRFYAINDVSARHYVRTLQYDTLYFPVVVPDQNISIEFLANHPRIPTADYMNVTIQVHPLLEPAVLARMAALAFTSVGGQDASTKAANLMQEFNSIVELAGLEGSVPTTVIESANKFTQFGWK